LEDEENGPKARDMFQDCLNIDCHVISRPSVSYSKFFSLKTPDLHSSGHSASLTAIEETPENMQGDPDAPEPAAEGNI